MEKCRQKIILMHIHTYTHTHFRIMQCHLVQALTPNRLYRLDNLNCKAAHLNLHIVARTNQSDCPSHSISHIYKDVIMQLNIHFLARA